MKIRHKVLKPMIFMIFILATTLVANAQSPFSVDTAVDIDTATAGEEEQTAEANSNLIEQIGWVRNDMANLEDDYVVITRSTVNVRSGPGTGFAIMQRTGRGDKHPLIREESGWYAMQIGVIDLDDLDQAWLRNDLAVNVKNIISITKDKINLRSGPSTRYSVVGTTTIGKTYPLVGTESNWYKIALMNAESIIPPSEPEEVTAAQQQFADDYSNYTRLVKEKGFYDSETQKALTRFRNSYGVYRILAKGSQALRNVRSSGKVDKIVIDKQNFTSTLYSNGKVVRVYPIAYGANPDGGDKQKVGDKRTPEGAFEIINRAQNPRYKNIPGGAKNNPLGTRWMGLNTWRGSIGMHGTSAPSSIGTRASGGCIRMFTPDAEELFDMVKVSLPVVISSVEGYDHPKPEPAEPPRAADPEEEVQPEPEPESEDNEEDTAIQPETDTPSNNIEDQSPEKTEKPKGFWNKVKSFFGNLFS
ncbi:MAG: L,D-transpeptidase family protein [Candidatus Rifleibacteriota bacterium]